MNSPTRGTPETTRSDHREEQPKERMKRAGHEGAEAAKDKARSEFEEHKGAAAEAVGSTSEALDDAAANLSAQGQESLAEGARAMSAQLSKLAGAIEGRSLDEMLSDARRLAREHPASFAAGGVALGLLLSRFIKASEKRPHASTSSSAAKGDGRLHAASGTTYRTESAATESAATDTQPGGF